MSKSGGGLEQALGKQLQSVRKQAGLTQQDLCHAAKLSYSTLAKIERGAIKAPSIFTIQSIADVLRISLDELVGREQFAAATLDKKTSKSGVKFVYFDINGCLVQFYHRAFTRLAEATGATADSIETSFWRYNDAICKGEMSMSDFNAALAQALQVDDVDWQAMYIDAVEPLKIMHELATWAAEHYHIGLISNIMPGSVDALLKKGLLPDLEYAAIVDSSEVHAIKPEQKIYEIAQGLSNCKPEEILFIDDSRVNVMAAAQLGWRVLWFDEVRPEESIDRIKTALEF